MGKLITVVGNSGVGKTTLSQVLCRQAGFSPALEQHVERPFQGLFAHHGAQYALPNQVDYLLLRAEQEHALRCQTGIGVVDGGLDEDFYVFTRRFHARGYLTTAEYQLIERLYLALRRGLPPPDLIIYLTAPLPVLAERFRRRGRSVEISTLEDLDALQTLLDDWLSTAAAPLLTVDATPDDPSFSHVLPGLVQRIQAMI